MQYNGVSASALLGIGRCSYISGAHLYINENHRLWKLTSHPLFLSLCGVHSYMPGSIVSVDFSDLSNAGSSLDSTVSMASISSDAQTATRRAGKKLDESFYFEDAFFEVSNNYSSHWRPLTLPHMAGAGHDLQSAQTRI